MVISPTRSQPRHSASFRFSGAWTRNWRSGSISPQSTGWRHTPSTRLNSMSITTTVSPLRISRNIPFLTTPVKNRAGLTNYIERKAVMFWGTFWTSFLTSLTQIVICKKWQNFKTFRFPRVRRVPHRVPQNPPGRGKAKRNRSTGGKVFEFFFNLGLVDILSNSIKLTEND